MTSRDFIRIFISAGWIMIAHESLSAARTESMDLGSANAGLDLASFRPYLLVLARTQDSLAGEEASDLVQKTLLLAYEQQTQFRGRTTAEIAGWLKQILRNQLIDTFRQRRRLRRDV